MNEITKVLTRKNSLRSALKELNLDQIEKLISDLNDIYADIEEEKKVEAAAELARLEKIKSIRDLINDAGIDIDELQGITSNSMRKKVEPKYRLIESYTGKTLEWSGRGRTPTWVSEYESRGGKREDLLIVNF